MGFGGIFWEFSEFRTRNFPAHSLCCQILQQKNFVPDFGVRLVRGCDLHLEFYGTSRAFRSVKIQAPHLWIAGAKYFPFHLTKLRTGPTPDRDTNSCISNPSGLCSQGPPLSPPRHAGLQVHRCPLAMQGCRSTSAPLAMQDCRSTDAPSPRHAGLQVHRCPLPPAMQGCRSTAAPHAWLQVHRCRPSSQGPPLPPSMEGCRSTAAPPCMAAGPPLPSLLPESTSARAEQDTDGRVKGTKIDSPWRNPARVSPVKSVSIRTSFTLDASCAASLVICVTRCVLAVQQCNGFRSCPKDQPPLTCAPFEL